jgi:hypothetical protein
MIYLEPMDIQKSMKMMISTSINSMKKIIMDMMMMMMMIMKLKNKKKKKKKKKTILIKL